jgi:hypothetical protein
MMSWLDGRAAESNPGSRESNRRGGRLAGGSGDCKYTTNKESRDEYYTEVAKSNLDTSRQHHGTTI